MTRWVDKMIIVDKVLKYVAILMVIWMEVDMHKKYIADFPSHTHAWAQADRYALAIGFQDNGLNFFQPQNYILNHQFPTDWNVPSEKRNTAVDFPIHDYIPAVVMKMSNTQAPWIFRSYILLYGLIGLYFLYRLAFLITSDFYKSIFVFLFIGTSPVLVYYQDGFLPTIPSLSNAIIGLFFYAKYLSLNRRKDFAIAFFFFTLATLSRFTFAIPEIAVLCYEALRIMRREKRIIEILTPVLTSVGVIAGYNIYNSYLRKMYGADFLSTMLPAKSLDEAKSIWQTVQERWTTQYFSALHYAILCALILLALYFLLRKRKITDTVIRRFWMITGILFIGNVAFAFLMLQQFRDHDYYFLDTFLLPISLFLILILNAIPEWRNVFYRLGIIAAIVITAWSFTNNAKANQKMRRYTSPDNTLQATIESFTGSDTFLDSLGISREAKMLVLDPVAPQIPFILMDRIGYVSMWMNKEAMENSLGWNFDYIVYRNGALIDMYRSHPRLVDRLERLATNGRITVCKLRKSEEVQTFLEYTMEKNTGVILHEHLDFEAMQYENWNRLNSSSDVVFCGKRAERLVENEEYGLIFRKQNNPSLFSLPHKLIFSANVFGKFNGDLFVVVSIDQNGINTHYDARKINDYVNGEDRWNHLQLDYDLPATPTGDGELSVYFWNPGGNGTFIDELEFLIH